MTKKILEIKIVKAYPAGFCVQYEEKRTDGFTIQRTIPIPDEILGNKEKIIELVKIRRGGDMSEIEFKVKEVK